MKHLAGMLLCVALLAVPAPAGAQQPSADRQARQLFDEAKAALSTGRFAEARDLLRRSLALKPKPSSAFNLAVALRGTGQTLAAVDMFDALLDGEYGPLAPGKRKEVARLQAQTRAEVATLHIGVRGADEVEIRVDGERVGVLSEGERSVHRVDAGERVVTASAPGYRTLERRIEVERGSSRQLSLELEPSQAKMGTLVLEAAHPEDVLEIVGVGRGTGTLRRQVEPGEYEVHVSGPAGRRRSTVRVDPASTARVRLGAGDDRLIESPWLWTGLTVVAAGLAVGGYFLFRDDQREPLSDPVYGVITTLRAP